MLNSLLSETFSDCHSVQKVVYSIVSIIREGQSYEVIPAVGDL